jgi:hypothetical protein
MIMFLLSAFSAGEKLKELPLPDELSAHILPPWASTMVLAIDSPGDFL